MNQSLLSPLSTKIRGSADLDALFASIAADASTRDQDRIHPYDIVDSLRSIRFGALRLPVELGGSELTVSDLFAVVIRLAEADSNVAHIFRNHFHFTEAVLRQPDPLIREKWLAEIAAGRIFGFAAVEDPSAEHPTSLRQTTDGLILNGTKQYSTGTIYADWVLVRATGPDGRPTSVSIPTDRAGVTRHDDWDGIGQRLSGTGTTTFIDVRVDESEVIARRPDGPNNHPYHNTFAGLYLTAIVAGIVGSAIHDSIIYLRGRPRTFGTAPSKDPSDDPFLQSVVGKAAATGYALRAAVGAAASALDESFSKAVNGIPDLAAAHEAELRWSYAKIYADEHAVRATSDLFDLGGASASRELHNLNRHWRNARTLASHHPAAYRARSIGDLTINGTPLPDGVDR